MPKGSKIHAPTIITWIPVEESMPEDELPHRSYKLWGKDRESTDFVLITREHRERIDAARRVLVDGKWYWDGGDGITTVTHWANAHNPFFDRKQHEEYLKELHGIWKRNKSK